MKKLIFFFLMGILALEMSHAQYASQITGDLSTADIAVDADDNRVVVGTIRHYHDNDFDPSEEVFSLTGEGVTGFVASYDRSGGLNFAFNITDEEIRPSVFNTVVDTDAGGNIYVFGYFMGKADFDPSEEVAELSGANIFDFRCFLASYDSDGSFRFARVLPFLANINEVPISNNNVVNKLLTVDDAGNSYLLVVPQLPIGFDFDPGPGEFVIPGGKYVVSYDNNGGFRFGYQVPRFTRAIGCNGEGVQYLAGNMLDPLEKELDFDPGPGTFFIENIDSSAFFFASYSPEGALNFAKALNGPYSLAMFIDGNSSGDIFMAGKMTGVIDFDPGEGVTELEVSEFEPDLAGDIFIARYSATGELLMAQAMQDKTGQVCAEHITDMEVDEEGNLYLAGSLYLGVVDFDPSEESLELQGAFDNGPGTNNGDLFVAVYNQEGEVLFAYTSPESEIIYTALALEENCPVYSLAGNFGRAQPLFFPAANTSFEVTPEMGSAGFVVSLEATEIPGPDGCDITVGTDQVPSDEVSVELFPNPTNGLVNIQLGDRVVFSHVEIVNPLGQTVYTVAVNGRYLQIDMSELDSGFYFVRLFNNTTGKSTSFRLVKR